MSGHWTMSSRYDLGDNRARAGRTFAAFMDLQSCPRGLAVTDQAVAVPSSEPGQISERVFSTLPF